MVFVEVEGVDDDSELEVSVAQAFQRRCVQLDPDDVLEEDAYVRDLLRRRGVGLI